MAGDFLQRSLKQHNVLWVLDKFFYIIFGKQTRKNFDFIRFPSLIKFARKCYEQKVEKHRAKIYCMNNIPHKLSLRQYF